MSAERHLALSPDPRCVTQARHFVRDILLDWNLDELTDDAQLGTSELVANAVRHAGTDVMLTVRRGDAVVIDVRDAGPELDPTRPRVVSEPHQTGGRGLRIVQAICADWGVERAENGKSVWFSLALPVGGREDAEMFELSEHRDTVEPEPAASVDARDAGRQQGQARAAG